MLIKNEIFSLLIFFLSLSLLILVPHFRLNDYMQIWKSKFQDLI